jgi:single-stranded DNA-binding protein
MNQFAEFQILGRVGKIKEFNGSINVSLCANTPFKDRNGEKQTDALWNDVTIFGEKTRSFIKQYIKEGDLILARGRMRQNSYERDGQKVYTVDLICEDFSLLAHKFEKSEGEGD